MWAEAKRDKNIKSRIMEAEHKKKTSQCRQKVEKRVTVYY
jgi:hypothetical protein